MKPSTVRLCFLLFLLLNLSGGAAFSQTAERLDVILDTEEVSFAQAAGVILPAAGLLAPGVPMEEAFAKARRYFPRWADRDDPILMRELSYLVMESFGLSGGFMYALFPGPRYAYRALAWRRFLPPNPDPYRTVKGEELLYLTGRVLSHTGGDEPLPAPQAPGSPPVPAYAGEPEMEIRVEPGKSLPSGPEAIQPYKGEFEVD
jgi:hypothetical protein